MQKTGNFASQLGATVGRMPRLARRRRPDFRSVFGLPPASGAAIRDAFPGNIIPAQPHESCRPETHQPGARTQHIGFAEFHCENLSSPLNIDTFAGRVDFVQSTKRYDFGHFIYSEREQRAAPIFGLPSMEIPGSFWHLTTGILGLGRTHVFSPTNLSEFRPELYP